MSMQSLALLPELENLPAAEDAVDLGFTDTVTHLRGMDKDHFAVELAEGVEIALKGLFQWRNVPDVLTQAHDLAFPNDGPLNDHYQEVLARGPAAVRGFWNNLKGKVAELEALPLLEDRFPGYNFSLAENPNQTDWDIYGVSPEGDELYVQVKTQMVENVSRVTRRIEESADLNIQFVLNQELYDRVLESNPDYSERLIESRMSNAERTESTEQGVELLAQNMGIDVPDGIGEMLPYAGEIILGIRLVMDIVSTERDFRDVELADRSRVHAIKALVLMSKFGVTTVLTTAGGAGGTAAGTALFPGVGSAAGGIVGSIAGVGTAAYLNRRLQPHMMEVGMALAGVDEEDMFYFRNKRVIDSIGASLAATKAA